MKAVKTTLDGVVVVEPKVFADNRGFFMESYNHKAMTEIGIPHEFVQDNHSASGKNTLRGLHYQVNHPQDKLVRCTAGRVYDVVVDIRRGSPSFGRWEGFVLSSDNKRMLFVPKGFAHGFCVLSDYAEFCYKCTDYWYPADERGIMWNDPEIGVEWPLDGEPVLSAKDLKNSSLKDADLWFEYGKNC